MRGEVAEKLARVRGWLDEAGYGAGPAVPVTNTDDWPAVGGPPSRPATECDQAPKHAHV